LEARGGIEPPIKVLQTFALPLGDRASDSNPAYKAPRNRTRDRLQQNCQSKKEKTHLPASLAVGAKL
jgi:hypothetical protein